MRNTRFIDNARLIESGTRFIPQTEFGVHTTITDRRHHFLARRNRSGRTLAQQIEHTRRQAFIAQGNPATIDLWYPPRGVSVSQHLGNRTVQNAIAEDRVLEENQRNFRFFIQAISLYSIILIITIPLLVI